MDMERLLPLEKVNQLALTDDEKSRVIGVFERMANEEARLDAIATDDVERMVHVIPLTNILREDVQAKHFTRDELQEGAPEKMDGYWQVPRLVE